MSDSAHCGESVDPPNTGVGHLIASLANKRLNSLIDNLPDIVIGNIFQYLYWKEKIFAAEAFPSWSRILESSLGWERFENARSYAHSHQALISSNYVGEEITCIAQYGQFFGHCVIWIQNFLPIDSPVETDFIILKALETHCPRLRSITINHPPNLSSSSLILSYVQYILPLQSLLNSETRVQLGLCRLLYSSVETIAGSVDLLSFYRSHNILQKVTVLDFSHGLILASTISPLTILIVCTSLRVLKCPIQALTTSIIQELLKRSLQELYVVNDEHTLNLNFVEKVHINWMSLVCKTNQSFQVHAIFRNRAVCPVHMCTNPFLRTLVFDSLCSSMTRALIRCVADLYGGTLQHLAFIFTIWEPLVPFSGLEDLADNFQYMASRLGHLRTVLLNHIVPFDALISLATFAPWISDLLVYENKIFIGGHTPLDEVQMEVLQQEISRAVGHIWQPVNADDCIYKKSSCFLNMLFEEHVNQFEGFW